MSFTKKINLILLASCFFSFGFFSHVLFLKMQTSKQSPENLSFLKEIWKDADTLYPFDEPKEEDKIYAAANGLIQAYGDPHSAFYDPEETQHLHETINGEFVGVGMEIDIRDGLLFVIAPLEGSPAQKGGMMAGDIIISIDDESVAEKTLFEILRKIRGEIGTEVRLGILRKGEKEEKKITLVRGHIKIPILKKQIIGETFVVSLYNFNEGSFDTLKEALKEFSRSSQKNLLIDVRNNPGGYLRDCIDIMSAFLEQGAIILYEDEGKKEYKEYRSKGNRLVKRKHNIGVLINEGSASASEILAGALQDHKKAVILGKQSYGKGSVQQLIETPHNTSLKMTIAHWLTPNKHQISGKGITPDILIEGDSQTDKYLKKAVQIFEKKIQ